MINETDIIELAPYSPDYPQRYAAEVGRLQPVLSPMVPVFHHVGSTAVPGLAAKPTIDIAASVTEFPLPPTLTAVLEQLGYLYWADNPAADYQLFIKGVPRTHHLHVYGPHSARLRDKLVFRDFLRRKPEVAAAYELLKYQLAAGFRTDREGYTEGKTAFVRQILHLAHQL
ncbi:MAG: GrpB family protein [Hymenobacter sp.]|nr:GrpB family protein [Hymenobacter sp.]